MTSLVLPLAPGDAVGLTPAAAAGFAGLNFRDHGRTLRFGGTSTDLSDIAAAQKGDPEQYQQLS